MSVEYPLPSPANELLEDPFDYPPVPEDLLLTMTENSKDADQRKDLPKNMTIPIPPPAPPAMSPPPEPPSQGTFAASIMQQASTSLKPVSRSSRSQLPPVTDPRGDLLNSIVKGTMHVPETFFPFVIFNKNL